MYAERKKGCFPENVQTFAFFDKCNKKREKILMVVLIGAKKFVLVYHGSFLYVI